MASELWWVSVGGERCEPCRVVTATVNDVEQREVFTIGCNDGTVFAPGCGMVLVMRMSSTSIPPQGMTEDEKEKRDREWTVSQSRLASHGMRHSYRRFDD